MSSVPYERRVKLRLRHTVFLQSLRVIQVSCLVIRDPYTAYLQHRIGLMEFRQDLAHLAGTQYTPWPATRQGQGQSDEAQSTKEYYVRTFTFHLSPFTFQLRIHFLHVEQQNHCYGAGDTTVGEVKHRPEEQHLACTVADQREIEHIYHPSVEPAGIAE